MSKFIKVSLEDNDFLKAYNKKQVYGEEISRYEDNQYDRIGSNYAPNDDWYYQFKCEEDHYYVVLGS